MKATGLCMVWLTTLMAFAWLSGASGNTDAPHPDDVLHVHLHNATHGQLGEDHEVHARLLQHNSSHSVLHLNSSTAGLHRDVLVSHDVLDDMNLDSDPVNGSHSSHGEWSGHEQLVATEDGWMSSPLNNSLAVEDREGEMADADQHHQASGVQLWVAIFGAGAAVVLIAGAGIWVFRGRRRDDAALLGEEDEEFTVFSVVDHQYPGKKGGDYEPLH